MLIAKLLRTIKSNIKVDDSLVVELCQMRHFVKPLLSAVDTIFLKASSLQKAISLNCFPNKKRLLWILCPPYMRRTRSHQLILTVHVTVDNLTSTLLQLQY